VRLLFRHCPVVVFTAAGMTLTTDKVPDGSARRGFEAGDGFSLSSRAGVPVDGQGG